MKIITRTLRKLVLPAVLIICAGMAPEAFACGPTFPKLNAPCIKFKDSSKFVQYPATAGKFVGSVAGGTVGVVTGAAIGIVAAVPAGISLFFVEGNVPAYHYPAVVALAPVGGAVYGGVFGLLGGSGAGCTLLGGPVYLVEKLFTKGETRT